MNNRSIASWSLFVEWKHPNGTWYTECVDQDSLDKTTMKQLSKFLKKYEKTELKQEEIQEVRICGRD